MDVLHFKETLPHQTGNLRCKRNHTYFCLFWGRHFKIYIYCWV